MRSGASVSQLRGDLGAARTADRGRCRCGCSWVTLPGTSPEWERGRGEGPWRAFGCRSGNPLQHVIDLAENPAGEADHPQTNALKLLGPTHVVLHRPRGAPRRAPRSPRAHAEEIDSVGENRRSPTPFQTCEPAPRSACQSLSSAPSHDRAGAARNALLGRQERSSPRSLSRERVRSRPVGRQCQLPADLPPRSGRATPEQPSRPRRQCPARESIVF